MTNLKYLALAVLLSSCGSGGDSSVGASGAAAVSANYSPEVCLQNTGVNTASNKNNYSADYLNAALALNGFAFGAETQLLGSYSACMNIKINCDGRLIFPVSSATGNLTEIGNQVRGTVYVANNANIPVGVPNFFSNANGDSINDMVSGLVILSAGTVSRLQESIGETGQTSMCINGLDYTTGSTQGVIVIGNNNALSSFL